MASRRTRDGGGGGGAREILGWGGGVDDDLGIAGTSITLFAGAGAGGSSFRRAIRLDVLGGARGGAGVTEGGVLCAGGALYESPLARDKGRDSVDIGLGGTGEDGADSCGKPRLG